MLGLAETIDQSLSLYGTLCVVKSICFIHLPIYEMGSSYFQICLQLANSVSLKLWLVANCHLLIARQL